jgi:hypothetical protein
MIVDIPIRTESEMNRRDHWRERDDRRRCQQQSVAVCLYCAGRPALPVHVTMTRIGPRRMDDDNLAGALKHVRDEIARWLGVDDGDKARVTWQVEQQRGKLHGVRVVFQAR